MSLSLSLYQSARKSQSRQKACPVAGGDGLKVIQVPRRFVENEWGGTETAILQTSRVLNALGNRSMIYTTTALCDRRHEQMGGVSVHRHNYLYPFWGLSLQDRHDMDRKGGNLMSFSMLWSLLRTKRPDILHAHTGKRLGGIVRTVARLRGLPYVISLHGGVVDVPGDEIQKMLAPLRGKFEWGRALGAVLGARRVLEDASAIICVGKNEQEAVSTRYPGQRVEWIPNGVDSKRFATGNGPAFRTKNHIPQASKLIVCVGRIDYQKNQLALLPVLSHLLGQQKDVHLALIGPVTVESYREQLIKEISRQGLDGRVTLIPGIPGSSPELVDAYHAADVFCLPSRHEPFGIVILEAWAAGLPVVASAVGGIPTFTRDGVDIIHADPEDPQTFSDAIDLLLLDPDRARRIAENGRLKAQRDYDWSQVTRRLEALYLDLVKD
jgi:glycosyltransferase involved in cell wall biosynthesis